MGTNKLRTKRGRTPSKTHADKQQMYESWLKKIDEYIQLELEQMITLLRSGTITGTYLKALERAIEMKQELLTKQKAQNEQHSEKSTREGNPGETIGNQPITENVREPESTELSSSTDSNNSKEKI